jgi:hypothetical protein
MLTEFLSTANFLESMGNAEIVVTPLALECVLLSAKRVFCNRRINPSVHASHCRIDIGVMVAWSGVSLSE